MTLYVLSFEQVFSWITFFYIEKKQYWNFYKSEVSWAYTCLSCIKSVCMEVSFYSEEIFFPLVYIYIYTNGLFSCLFHNNKGKFHLEEYLLHVLLKIPSTLFLE